MPDPANPTTTAGWPTDELPPRPAPSGHTAATPPAGQQVTHRQVQQRLDAELATAAAELARVDAKTATLLGLAGVLLGGGLAVLGSTSPQIPAAVAVPAWAAAAAVAAAVVLLAWAVRPNLNGGYGFMRWCTAGNPKQLLDALAADVAGDPLTDTARQLRWLSCALVSKYVAVRRAVTLLLVGLGAGTIAAAAMWAR